MDNKVICAVTGRNIWDIGNGLSETYYKNIEIKMAIAEKITELADGGVTDFLCHADYGFPLWACEIILALRDVRVQQGLSEIRLHLFMPWEEMSSDWEDSVHDRFYAVHKKADEVWVMHPQYSDKAMENCERMMIDNSHLLFTDDKDYFAAQYAWLHGKQVVECEALELS